MKRELILLTYVLTIILLLIQAQSTIAFISENYLYLHNYKWSDYFVMYTISGIVRYILASSYAQIYNWTILIIFCLNLYAIMLVVNRKEVINTRKRYFFIFNVIFIVLKTLEFCIDIYFKLGA